MASFFERATKLLNTHERANCLSFASLSLTPLSPLSLASRTRLSHSPLSLASRSPLSCTVAARDREPASLLPLSSLPCPSLLPLSFLSLASLTRLSHSPLSHLSLAPLSCPSLLALSEAQEPLEARGSCLREATLSCLSRLSLAPVSCLSRRLKRLLRLEAERVGSI